MTSTLFRRLESSGRMPTPPGVVIKLLDLTRQPNVSVSDISDTIAMDPVLSAKILRFVNSPMVGMSKEVTSLNQAVALLGMRGVKMMALSFSVLSSPGPTRCTGFNPKQFTAQSLACGIASKRLSRASNIGSPQEAFLVGLLSQIGRSLLAAALPEEYANVLQAADRVPDDLPVVETAAWGEDYTTVGAQLLRTWQIPETLCSAIESFRHSDNHASKSDLARILRVGEMAASVICPDGRCDTPSPPDRFLQAAESGLALSEAGAMAVIDEIINELEEVRVILELPKGHIRSIEELESEVRDRIAELSMAMHLENQTMARQQEDLMRRATTDPLTHIGNRASFDARMSMELERAARSRAPLALLMIDIDKFKNINDTYGHQAGDRVLQSVARLLDDNMRKVDYVARYGGEEFAVIAPGALAEGVLNLAERLRRTVEETPLSWNGEKLQVTISIGVAVFREIADGNRAPSIIRTADEQLYAAKCAGRNRVKLTASDSPIDLPCRTH